MDTFQKQLEKEIQGEKRRMEENKNKAETEEESEVTSEFYHTKVTV